MILELERKLENLLKKVGQLQVSLQKVSKQNPFRMLKKPQKVVS